MSGNIYIPKPCHENWNKMTPEEKGRHCAVCSKVVKDFSKMKTDDIIDTLKNTEGEVCGRIGIHQLTPTTNKQKLNFWVTGSLYKRVIYPLMALLGMTFVTKKVVAQNHQVKGKMAYDYNDYQTSDKKLNIIVTTTNNNVPITGATIHILNGITEKRVEYVTDSKGRVAITVKKEELIKDEITLEIYADGYEYRTSTVKLVKDVQTLEIKMEEEIMMMGEMIYIPEENKLMTDTIIIPTPDTTSHLIKDPIMVIHCGLDAIMHLQNIEPDVIGISIIEPVDDELPESVDVVETPEPATQIQIENSPFEVFPVPSSDQVSIISVKSENFNLDVLDANGKKIHSVVNSNSRYTLDVTNYAAGIYYVVITVNGKAIETRKIIVAR